MNDPHDPKRALTEREQREVELCCVHAERYAEMLGTALAINLIPPHGIVAVLDPQNGVHLALAGQFNLDEWRTFRSALLELPEDLSALVPAEREESQAPESDVERCRR